MIPALLIGRAGSSGFKNKNVSMILGRPLMSYPILAAQHSKLVDKVFLSTDSDNMKQIGLKLGAQLIDRPDFLATQEALAEDAFAHGYRAIRDQNAGEIEFIVLLFCNGATITPGIIDRGIEALRTERSFDSAATVSRYNMWSPLRAKKIVGGELLPFVGKECFDAATCDRDSQGDTFFADCSAFVVRPKCLEDLNYGDPPFRWMGRKVYPLDQWGGLDIDYEWQVGQVEYWLRQYGFTEHSTPYDESVKR
jgi:hypothetical protein